MANNNYSTGFRVNQSPEAVFNAILDIPKWWSTDYEGSSANLGDDFVIHHPGQHYSKQRLVEKVPGEKLAWLVTDSRLYWLKNDQQEWTDTRMVFELTEEEGQTMLRFTHEGLVPGKECFEMCQRGWAMIINDWLFHLVTTGQSSAGMLEAAKTRNQALQEWAEKAQVDYHWCTLVDGSPVEVMKKVAQLDQWWKKDFSGSAENLGDRFRVPFSDPSFVDFSVSECLPGKKLSWKVVDCYLPWFTDTKEWNNTEVCFELSVENNKTKLDFTHKGLGPSLECYEVCEKGWNGHLSTLEKFINEGVGI